MGRLQDKTQAFYELSNCNLCKPDTTRGISKERLPHWHPKDGLP
jgi:hypothetical protein